MIIISVLLIICIVYVSVYIFMHQPQFGKQPKGNRLERIKESLHYKNGAFQNLSYTPIMADDTNFFRILKDFWFGKSKRSRPKDPVPSEKTDLLNLDPSQDVLIWFGHSSYFIQLDGIKILVDPVMSGHASPFSFSVKAFKGTDPYTTNDIPEIDYLLITHDHWDHLDYKTIKKLKPKIKHIICGLGVGETMEYWGFDTYYINEQDWDETIVVNDSLKFHTAPSRHFSGRTFKRNKTQWTSFILETPDVKIFMGCDGGYDSQFAEAGKKFGGFDLAILDNGQSNKNWKYIHASPEEVLQAAKDLNTKRLFPVHNSKFTLALHDWDYPLKRITELNKNEDLSIITPKIGEPVNLREPNQQFTMWWKVIE